MGDLSRRLESAGVSGDDEVLPSGFSEIVQPIAASHFPPRDGMSDPPAHRLPGDRSPAEEIARMLRVDHAGEYGATRIYEGQLDVLGRGPVAGVVRQMAEVEKRHLTR